MAAQAEANHSIEIVYEPNTNEVTCVPELEEHARRGQTIEWSCNQPHWAVVFGPDAPFSDLVLGGGKTITTVTARRPGDFHKHKYVAVVWTGGELVTHDPEVDVED